MSLSVDSVLWLALLRDTKVMLIGVDIMISTIV